MMRLRSQPTLGWTSHSARARRLLPRRSLVIMVLAALPGCVPPAAVAPPVTPPPALPTDTPVAVDAGRIAPEATLAQSVETTPGLATLAMEARASGLAAILGAAGPYTVFAPSDAAYARLPRGVVRDLLSPDNRATLALLLRNHIVAGAIDTETLSGRIAAGGGRTTLMTLAGQPLVATLTDGVVTLTSTSGEKAYIEIADLPQANGMIQVVNGVLTPTLPSTPLP